MDFEEDESTEDIERAFREGRKVVTARPSRQVPEHNHLTRDIRPEGKCPACDLYWQARGGMVVDEGPPDVSDPEVTP